MSFLTKNKLQVFLFIIIFILALFVRVYRLDLDLPNLYSDEVDLHYKTFNWVLHSSPFTLSGLFNYAFYGTFTYTWLLDLNPLGVRLPAALYMTFVVVLMFFFGKVICDELKIKNLSIPLLIMFLAAFLPWTFITSRIGFAHISLLTVILLIHFILFIKAKRFKEYLFSLIPLLLAAFYYQSIIVAAPFGLLLIYIQIKKITSKKELLIFSLICVVFLFLIALVFLYRPNFSNVSVGARGIDLALWNDVNVTSETNLYRGLSRSSEPSLFSFYRSPEEMLNKIFFNRVIATTQKITTNYLSYFSPEFLFLKGDPVLRHSTSQTGNFYLILLPFMIIGFFYFYKEKNTKLKYMFLVWILVSPLATSLTKDGFAGLNRVTSMMPFLTFISVFGIYKSFIALNKYRLMCGILIGLFLIVSIYYYLFGYFHVYPALASKDFEYGFKQLSDFQVDKKNAPMFVIWEGYYPHWHFRFWQKTSWEDFNNFKEKTSYQNNSIFTQKFFNLYFGLPEKDEDLLDFVQKEKIELIVLPDKYKLRYAQITKHRKIKEINYPDDSNAFSVYTIK